uniref:Uncharacterized protein n=1 Tax=Lactuca sativa TaxID=4236 RepID=A0A9R1XWA4_LACSA|nr:hypothetical protein LSAT_V11C100014550 [Lactuca sativa]
MNEEDLVLQALRRLKGSSNRKEKMSAETKIMSDQLTEDAMKLVEDGDYNVYDEKQEVFQREAEGFENLACARGEGTSSSSGNKQPNSSGMSYIKPSFFLVFGADPLDLKVGTATSVSLQFTSLTDQYTDKFVTRFISIL